jgi:hypothetical protein
VQDRCEVSFIRLGIALAGVVRPTGGRNDDELVETLALIDSGQISVSNAGPCNQRVIAC